MSVPVETRYDEEGSDTVKQFLLKHCDTLKKGVYPLYDALKENEIDDYDELIQYEAIDLRAALEPEIKKRKLKAIHIGKLINVLRSIPDSFIYKSAEKEKVIISVISTEEQNALKQINDKNINIQRHIENIILCIDNLKENKIKNKNIIDKQFDLIIESVKNRKNELIKDLDDMVNDKERKLKKQMNDLKDITAQLTECYDTSQAMIHDINIDALKRKTKILTDSQQLLENHNISNINSFEMCTSFKINTVIDIHDIDKMLSNTGNVLDIDTPKAPIINIKTEKSKSVQLNIIANNNDNIIGYKLQYIQNRDDMKQDDDMKIDWINIEINNSSKNIHHEINKLKPATNYLLRGLIRNKIGFGTPSNMMTFTTKKLQAFILDVSTNGVEGIIKNDGKTFCTKNATFSGWATAACSKGISHGVHEFKFKIKANGDTGDRIGITSDIDSCKTSKNNYYYSGKTYYVMIYGDAYVAGDITPKFTFDAFKMGDIIKMVLDHDSSLVRYYKNEECVGSLDIAQNLTYYVHISSYYTTSEYDII